MEVFQVMGIPQIIPVMDVTKSIETYDLGIQHDLRTKPHMWIYQLTYGNYQRQSHVN